MSDAIVSDLLERGYGVVELADDSFAALRALIETSQAFFARSQVDKLLHTTPDGNYGYRPMGQEYSLIPERPDLVESFSLWSQRIDMVPRSTEIGELVRALLDWRTVAVEMTRSILSAVATSLRAEPPTFERSSQVQVNNCLSTQSDRALIHDRHEDGHIITLLHPTGAGLELFPLGRALEPDIGPSELLVIPGSTLTDLTGGLIEPLEHRVRNLGLSSRQAVMYFVNPELSDPIFPWVGSASDRRIDLRETIRSRPASYGLPDVPLL
jgi:isopenicillin N synthase-like dioxygenase